ncbi:MAG: undecaprenyl/decaprenyl-phosphate alpha-N-acetylglucosaminyl 1-phosphate transferase [Candidatus Cloacimonetes bacterium]|nr:undecaprenyl/decaprenyl-phosphate alpha-N-acetylglucosaminyl 1-phosphate transferase [Candidatus Cloacimonadota bacterium]
MIFFSAFIVSIITTWGLIQLTKQQGWVSRPKGDRWNARTVSLHGGIGIGLSFSLCFLFWNLTSSTELEILLVCMPLMMMMVGLYDDIYQLMPAPKLISQILVAAAAIVTDIDFAFLAYEPLNWALTLLWIVGITNALNLLDNMDGAAPGIAFFSVLSLCLLPWNPTPWLTDIAMMLAGSIAGFLIFNFHPAKIFMGDSGSLFLGNLIALMLIQFSRTISPDIQHTFLQIPSALIIPVLLIIVPIIDTTYVSFNRWYNGFPISLGDKGHITHRLSFLFQSDWFSVLILYAYQLLVCIIVASYHWTLFYPLFLVTLWLLYKLTIKTNAFVWPEKYISSLEARTSHRYLFLKRHMLLYRLFRLNSQSLSTVKKRL